MKNLYEFLKEQYIKILLLLGFFLSIFFFPIVMAVLAGIITLVVLGCSISSGIEGAPSVSETKYITSNDKNSSLKFIKYIIPILIMIIPSIYFYSNKRYIDINTSKNGNLSIYNNTIRPYNIYNTNPLKVKFNSKIDSVNLRSKNCIAKYLIINEDDKANTLIIDSLSLSPFSKYSLDIHFSNSQNLILSVEPNSLLKSDGLFTISNFQLSRAINIFLSVIFTIFFLYYMFQTVYRLVQYFKWEKKINTNSLSEEAKNEIKKGDFKKIIEKNLLPHEFFENPTLYLSFSKNVYYLTILFLFVILLLFYAEANIYHFYSSNISNLFIIPLLSLFNLLILLIRNIFIVRKYERWYYHKSNETIIHDFIINYFQDKSVLAKGFTTEEFFNALENGHYNKILNDISPFYLKLRDNIKFSHIPFPKYVHENMVYFIFFIICLKLLSYIVVY